MLTDGIPWRLRRFGVTTTEKPVMYHCYSISQTLEGATDGGFEKPVIWTL
jgi:hypothetical protein